MNLSYFVGKICTILTAPVNVQFQDFVQHAQYFTGRVTAIDPDGIWVRHLQADTMAFFSLPVVGIVEEQNVPEDSPLMQELRKNMSSKDFIPSNEVKLRNNSSVEHS